MSRIFIALLLMVLPRVLSAQSVLYITSGNGSASTLYTVDPLSAQVTAVAPVLFNGSTSITITALAFHPTTGVLFGVSGNEYSPGRQLLNINPATGFASSLGTIGTSSNQNTSDFSFASNGTLYGWTVRGGPLVTVDPTNATRTVIGSAANGTQSNGLAFAPNGTLYLAGPTTGGNLYTVNTSTGALTVAAAFSNVPTTLGNINAMAFDGNGILYATGGGGGHELVTINTTTGVITTIGILPFEADAIVFKTIPEPSTLVLASLGILALMFYSSRRRLV